MRVGDMGNARPSLRKDGCAKDGAPALTSVPQRPSTPSRKKVGHPSPVILFKSPDLRLCIMA